MINEIVKVKYMPLSVREACTERGHSLDAEMTIKEAMCEYVEYMATKI